MTDYHGQADIPVKMKPIYGNVQLLPSNETGFPEL